MALNCRPGQLARVCVPPTRREILLGLYDLNGCVVTTVSLHPKCPPEDPSWILEEELTTRTTKSTWSQFGFIPAGTVMRVEAIPDAYLRPIADFTPAELEEQTEELAA